MSTTNIQTLGKNRSILIFIWSDVDEYTNACKQGDVDTVQSYLIANPTQLNQLDNGNNISKHHI